MNTKEHTEEMDGGERNERDDNKKKNCKTLKLKMAAKIFVCPYFYFSFHLKNVLIMCMYVHLVMNSDLSYNSARCLFLLFES